MTEAEGNTSVKGISKRVAETTIGFNSGGCAQAILLKHKVSRQVKNKDQIGPRQVRKLMMNTRLAPTPPSPTVLGLYGGLHTTALLAGIRADGNNLCRLPTSLFKTCSGSVDRSGATGLVRLTVAGAAQVGWCRASDIHLLLPVKLRECEPPTRAPTLTILKYIRSYFNPQVPA